MKHRRDVIKGLISGAAGGMTTAGLAATPHSHDTPVEEPGCDCCGSEGRTSLGKIFPNVPVVTHELQQAVFYNDLIRGKTVLLNFMSIAGDATYPVTENLAKVQDILGDRLGHDVFMYSVTVDPQRDTPEALGKFAATYGVRSGWQFLTGDPKSIALVHRSFFIHDAGHSHHHEHGPDCSLGVARYGNDAIGTWGTVATRTSPQWIAERLNWVKPRTLTGGPPRRKGPRPTDVAVRRTNSANHLGELPR